MFPVTRISANLTTISRKLVKKVATNKINLNQASPRLADLHNAHASAAPYSKNIFKRTYNWIKTFIIVFKTVVEELKDEIAKIATKAGKKLSFKEKLAHTKKYVQDVKKALEQIKKEMTRLCNTNSVEIRLKSKCPQ